MDTTVQPAPGAGHPFAYFSQEKIDTHDDDIKRLVREYEPSSEFVIVILKPDDRTSSYRIKAVQRK